MEPLHRTVPDFLAALLRKAPLSPEKLAFTWRSVVGPAVARVSAVHLSAEGIVEVQCPDDHWRREIRRSAPMITERLVFLLGSDVVKKLKVPGASRPASRRKRTSGPRPAPGT
jgi:predicted nucleic acid-binding Zn ribbon protein